MRLVLALVAAVGFAATAAEADDGGVPADAGTARRYSAEEVKAVVEAHVRAKASADDGVYRLKDDRSGDELGLEFVSVAMVGNGALWPVHNPTRKDAAGEYFACVNFRAFGGPPARVYDVDVLLAERDGQLAVREVFVHKEPRLVEGRWVKVVRGP